MGYARRKTTKFSGKEHMANADAQLEALKHSASSLDKRRLLRLRTFIDTRLNTLYGVDEIGYL